MCGKLHRLLESRISDKRSQITADLTKELNRMLGIATKLSVTFYPQTGIVLEVIYESLAEGLTRIVGNGRVCSK